MGTLLRHMTVEAVVDAPPTAVWEVVGDPRRTGDWSHECHEVVFVDGSVEPAVGARFRGRNQVGRAGWTRTSEIVGYQPGREISWRTVPTAVYRDSTIWTITVEPSGDGGTRLTQHYEVVRLSAVMDRLFYLLAPAHRDRHDALEADLRRIGEVARAPRERTAG
jgi:uncharacterized protein YndB with AHSA1/START domain